MADVSDTSELFDLELHEDDKARDSDDDRIELDDVSNIVNYAAARQLSDPLSLALAAHPYMCCTYDFPLCLPSSLCLGPLPTKRKEKGNIFSVLGTELCVFAAAQKSTSAVSAALAVILFFVEYILLPLSLNLIEILGNRIALNKCPSKNNQYQ